MSSSKGFPPLSSLSRPDRDGYVVMSTGEHVGFEEIRQEVSASGNPVTIFRRVREFVGDPELKATMRIFPSGAIRDVADGKFEYTRFLDPLVLREFAAYMHKKRQLPDGSRREPDNWKHGIPRKELMASLGRHYHELWEIHETGRCFSHVDGKEVDPEDALCGLMFNVMAYLYDVIQEREGQGSNWGV